MNPYPIVSFILLFFITRSVEIEKAFNRRIYPNPFVDGINIDMHNSSSANRISTEIFDITGRSIYLQNFRNVSAGNNTLRIDPKSVSLKPGVYIVMVRVNGEIVQTSKLVKVGK